MAGAVGTGVVPASVAPDAPTAPKRVERFPCFDGLRAIAAFSVFAFHSYRVFVREDGTFIPIGLQEYLDPLGRIGVAIFFVISGFLLFRPYSLAMLEGRPAPRLGGFWKRRFFRIFPAYWIALAVVVFAVGQSTFASVGDGLSTFALVQGYRYGYYSLGLGVAWTLVVEVSFYIFLPLFAAALRAVIGSGGNRLRSVRIQLGVLIGMAVLGLVIRHIFFFGGPYELQPRGTWFSPSSIVLWLPSYLDWFAFGMLLALGSAWLTLGGGIHAGSRPSGGCPGCRG